ncbi:hypothetical protein BC832DRAFT_235717 [Gaertneriomyces semiglobifer]|nr:hypothetical protein BC832DRAFT_235717 [Gaertneriomyces semiglobifer]
MDNRLPKRKRARKGRNANAPEEETGAEQQVCVKLNVKCPSYTDNSILETSRMRYDPVVRDPAPHDPLANAFGAPTVPVAEGDGLISCYNEFDLLQPDVPAKKEEPQDEASYPLMGNPKENTGWPDSTSVHCWWCCGTFDTPPLGAPVSYSQHSDTFEVLGCFYSFACASAFMRNDRRKSLIRLRSPTALSFTSFQSVSSPTAPGPSTELSQPSRFDWQRIWNASNASTSSTSSDRVLFRSRANCHSSSKYSSVCS